MAPKARLLPTAEEIGNLVSIGRIAPQTPYSADFLRQLARSGKIRAYKLNRDWLTTPNAIRDYLTTQKHRHEKALSLLQTAEKAFLAMALLLIIFSATPKARAHALNNPPPASTAMSLLHGVAAAWQDFGSFYSQNLGAHIIAPVNSMAENISKNLVATAQEFLVDVPDYSLLNISNHHPLARASKQNGSVLGATTRKLATRKSVARTPAPDVNAMVKQLLQQYVSSGLLTGPQGPKGDPGTPATSNTGLTNNGSGQTTALIGGQPIVSYYQPDSTNNFSGGSLAGFSNLSSNSFTTGSAAVQNLTVQGSSSFAAASFSGALTGATSTFANLTVSGPSSFSGPAAIANLTVTGNATTTGNQVIGGKYYGDGSALTGNSGGGVTEQFIASGCYYTSGVNVVSINQNQQDTFNGKQYNTCADTVGHIKFVVRTLATGALATYTSSWTFDPSDEHKIVAMALDKNGYIHVAYGMHSEALHYRKSINPEDPSAFSSEIPMLGTNESLVTYPMFTKSPAGELYFTFRAGGVGNGDQYFYHYNATTQGWEAAAGTGTAGITINGMATPANAYLNGAPKWDGNGNLWWSWQWDSGGTLQAGEYVMYWNGTAFKKADGTAATIPITTGNPSAVYTPGTVPVDQDNFVVTPAGVVYVGYTRQDAANNYQVYVLTNNSGSWVEHQLTNTISLTSLNIGVTMVASGQYVYCIFSDLLSGVETGIAALQSQDGFITFSKFYIADNSNPNWALSYDLSRISSGVISFLWMDANDPQYGSSYLDTNVSNASLGNLSVIDWVPRLNSGLTKGLPQDLYGLNVVQANLIKVGACDGCGASQWTSTSTNLFYNQGNIGIGTTTVTSRLYVQGGGATSATSALNVVNSAGTSLLFVQNNGNIGIGTTTPAGLFDISGNSNTVPASASIRLDDTAGNASSRNWGIGNSWGINYGDLSFSNSTAAGGDPTANIRMTINKSGNVGIGTNNPTLGPLQMGSGAYVTSGGVWTNASDRNLKENFATLSPASILQNIDQLPITEWNYKNEDPSIKHIGPVAQDFYSIFHVGNASTSISTIDPSGIALLGIQALDQKIAALQGSLTGNATSSGQLTVYAPGSFSGDSVGQAQIKPGASFVRVTFHQPYQYQPIVTATIIGVPQAVFYSIDAIDATGFTIKITPSTPGLVTSEPVTFDWHSFASPAEQLTVSDGTTAPIQLIVSASPAGGSHATATLIVSPTPTPSALTATAAITASSTPATTPDRSGAVLGTATPTSSQQRNPTASAQTPSNSPSSSSAAPPVAPATNPPPASAASTPDASATPASSPSGNAAVSPTPVPTPAPLTPPTQPAAPAAPTAPQPVTPSPAAAAATPAPAPQASPFPAASAPAPQ